jgi:hypothetical protein
MPNSTRPRMKRVAVKAFLQHAQQKKAVEKRTLASERAKIKLPYKPEHVTEEQIKFAVAQLA